MSDREEELKLVLREATAELRASRERSSNNNLLILQTETIARGIEDLKEEFRGSRAWQAEHEKHDAERIGAVREELHSVAIGLAGMDARLKAVEKQSEDAIEKSQELAVELDAFEAATGQHRVVSLEQALQVSEKRSQELRDELDRRRRASDPVKIEKAKTWRLAVKILLTALGGVALILAGAVAQRCGLAIPQPTKTLHP